MKGFSYHSPRVTLLRGNLNNEKDCKRVALKSAIAAFILTSPADSQTSPILQAVSASNYAPENLFFASVIPSLLSNTLKRALGAESSLVVSFEELSLILLTRNIVCPGSLALLVNLTRSNFFFEEVFDYSTPIWILEYLYGSSHQVR